MKRTLWLILAGATCGLWITGCASPQRSTDVLKSRPADPLLPNKIVARVFIFVSNDCPIANRYSPDIRRLHEQFAPRGVAFWLVHSDPAETLAAVVEHNREYGLNLPVLMDPDHHLARLAKAQVVPTAAVFGPIGELVYKGRIDDRVAEIGRERAEPSQRDLQNALDAVVSHRKVSVPETRAIGCYIPDSR